MSTERIPIPLLTGATASNRLAEMYNRGPGLASLINPPRTDPGGADDRAAMMEMQRSTFAPYLSGNPLATSGGSTATSSQENVDPTEDIPFVDAVVNPNVEGGYEAPVSTTGTGGGQNIPSVPGANFTQQMEGLYGPYYGKNEFAGLPAHQGIRDESGRLIDTVGGGLSNAARFLIDKAGDLGERLVDRHPLVGGIASIFGKGGDDIDAYGKTLKGDMVSAEGFGYPILADTVSAEGLGLYPEDPAYVEPPESSPEDYLGIMGEPTDDGAFKDLSDPSNIIKEIDEKMKKEGIETQARINFLDDLIQKREVFENVQKGLQAKEDTSAAFGDHMGAMFAPDSGWGNATPMLSSNRDEQFATGRIGISGRMLPRASSGFGGRNPFAGEAPLPGSPDYADYVIDQMGFDPKKLQGEINKIVERDLPFVQAQDQQGNSVLIDKQTGEMTVIPVSEQVKEYIVQNPSTNFVGRVGGGMRHGGVATLMPLRY